jgi:UDP-glucose 4-epimerase
MREHKVKNFVFSSSATVYGFPQYLPLDEKHQTIGDQITNPYGKTKYVVEQILKDLHKSDSVNKKHFSLIKNLNSDVPFLIIFCFVLELEHNHTTLL